MFDEILADCLEALTKGATIRDCLTRYPAEAAALEPLLRLAVALSREGETRLSGDAFEQGRRRLLTASRTRQSATHRQPRHTPPAPSLRQNAFPPYQQNGLPKSQQRSRQLAHAKSAPRRFQLPRLLRVALLLLTIVSATTFVRQVATSLPGTWLYPVKNSSERMVGVLMTAAGEEISWQENQLERRLTEVNALIDATPTTVQSATQALEDNWQALLAASESLTVAERTQLIEAQIDRLQQFARSWANHQSVASETAVATVRKLIAAGETALATPTSVEETTIVAATATVTAVAATPTVTPTALMIATPTALLQPSATAPAAPILEPSPTPTPTLTLAPATDTATPVPPSPTALPTPLPEITVQIPLQESSQQETDRQEEDDDNASDASAPTATSTPLTPEAITTEMATVTPVVGTGPEEEIPTPTVLSTEAAATPTAADQLPTVTSGEEVLPLPTKPVEPVTATPEPVAPTARPTNQPGATKTPKATATPANTEPATPGASAGTSPTPVERTPNATTQASMATKEAATETPVAASPTSRATTGGGEVKKTPSP